MFSPASSCRSCSRQRTIAERVVSPLRGVRTLSVYWRLTTAKSPTNAATYQRWASGRALVVSAGLGHIGRTVYPGAGKPGKPNRRALETAAAAVYTGIG